MKNLWKIFRLADGFCFTVISSSGKGAGLLPNLGHHISSKWPTVHRCGCAWAGLFSQSANEWQIVFLWPIASWHLLYIGIHIGEWESRGEGPWVRHRSEYFRCFTRRQNDYITRLWRPRGSPYCSTTMAVPISSGSYQKRTPGTMIKPIFDRWSHQHPGFDNRISYS